MRVREKGDIERVGPEHEDGGVREREDLKGRGEKVECGRICEKWGGSDGSRRVGVGEDTERRWRL